MSETGDEFTIDGLAARAGMTVRNVRAHLSRGLLPAGELRGRTAYYTTTHLARLELISGLQRRGFSLAAIGVLINQTSSGGAEEALRLYRGMLAPWEPEKPVEMAAEEFPGWLGVTLPDGALDELRTSGLIEETGHGRLRVMNPGLVMAGAQAVAIGVPAAAVLEVGLSLEDRTRGIAELFVAMFRDHLWNPHVAAGLPRDGGAEVRTAVEALQPVATQALLAAFRSTMQQTMDSFIAELSEDLVPRDRREK
ncbi:MerR-like DNA binding protein [Pseudonocardia sediminis]|uniref:MerR-like DNA binding protein n=1 Tax=Pseudonocardia sediminis TaxID=1397368 RepID=A0A4Q7UU54_PSEST|nr:MerR family transcriptional regulator [Pseudonocardia sediminis]RZT84544.1 MerR-like DNA binding protein [Pseudonocardia sediminis]